MQHTLDQPHMLHAVRASPTCSAWIQFSTRCMKHVGPLSMGNTTGHIYLEGNIFDTPDLIQLTQEFREEEKKVNMHTR